MSYMIVKCDYSGLKTYNTEQPKPLFIVWDLSIQLEFPKHFSIILL